MINIIRMRFIRIALLALTVAMLFVTAVINIANWISVRQEMEDSLTLLVQADGRINNMDPQDLPPDSKTLFTKDKHSRESIYESRYFSILYSADGNYSIHDMSHIASYTEEDALALAESVIQSGKTAGFLSNFLFTVYAKDDAQVLIFLDCETKLSAVHSLLWISGLACVLGIALAWLMVALYSKRAIRPLIENAEKQKRFITDAGHELKTPLTVISANMELLSMEVGPNEWVQSTQKQVVALRALVNELVFLSRMDEEDVRIPQQTFQLSAAFRDVTAAFSAMAEYQGKTFTATAQDNIPFTGDESAIRRLISVLCDNAVKYAPDGDHIMVRLSGTGKHIVLETVNTLAEPMDEKTVAHLFDRFYRADESRTKSDRHGGYGIGLAIAKAVVEKHNGKIAVVIRDQQIHFTCTWTV